ncbi:MAG: hypothetical protein Kow0092_04820 [Deferrisomatales bacterium]
MHLQRCEPRRVTAGLRIAVFLAALGFWTPSPGQVADIEMKADDPGASRGGVWSSEYSSASYSAWPMYCWMGDSTDWFRWTPNIPEKAYYEVYLWWVAKPQRSAAVPVTIHHANGAVEVLVNQQVAGGQWNRLGQYLFEAGSVGDVEISGRNGEASADAVRFVYVAPAENQPPVAVSDEAETFEDQAVDVAVLANDSDPEGGTLALQSVTAPLHGTATAQPNQTVRYAPAAGFQGVDTFSYTASDVNGATASATVTVTVSRLNHAPVATDDAATTAEDTAAVIAVLENDSDPDGDPLTVTALGAPAHGVATVIDDTTIQYVPAPDFHGTDAVTYTVDDGYSGTASATVTVTITSVNDPPVATNDTAVTNPGIPVTRAVLANDTDPDGDTLTLVSAGPATNGAVSIQPDQSVRYSPFPGVTGSDSVPYTVSDASGATAAATLSVTIQDPAPEPPVEVVVDDTDPGATYGGNWSTGTSAQTYGTWERYSYLTSNDNWFRFQPTLPEAGIYEVHLWWVAKSWRSVTVPVTVHHAGGSTQVIVSHQVNGGQWNALGAWPFEAGAVGDVEISGRNGEASADAARFVLVNRPPVAGDDKAITAPDRWVEISVLDNDSDPDGDPLAVQAVHQASQGTAELVAPGLVRYTPQAGFTGADTFTYTVSDAPGNAATATVTVAADSDGDGISDLDEANLYGTNASESDTDGDGILDGDEVGFWATSWNADWDGDGVINLLDTDSNNDGTADGWEDADGDGIADSVERKLGTDVQDPMDAPVLRLEYAYDPKGQVTGAHSYLRNDLP